MLNSDERSKPLNVRDSAHIYQRFYERGKKLFGQASPKEMLKECFDAIRNPKKSVIVKDDRNKDSTHHCIFISDAGGYVCLPIHVNKERITVITIKDIKDDNQPLWYIRNYNELASARGLPQMNYTLPNT